VHLPFNYGLPVNLLAACFNNTSATYKYYWFLSIIQSIEGGSTTIQKKDLFARMISNAWYTVNYFHISFGKQDRLQRAIEIVKSCEPLTIDDKRDKILNHLINTNNKNSLNQLKYFNNQVPHWFLSPWFPRMNRNDIYIASQGFKNQCLYSLTEDTIVINEEWVNYLNQNIKVLKDFCFWNLVFFLQAKNPNVPDIPNKLIKPALRNSLNNQRKNFWDIVVKELGSVDCIYTGKKLTVGNYAVEHFIPYSFVSHDLIWNLIPADKSFNGSKSDKLPPLDKYFNPFFLMQESAIKIVKEKNPKNKLLEDYLTIFSDLEESNGLSEYFTKEKFRDRLQPLITIASNNGFEFMH
jgi:HNH endonuclease